MAELLFFAGTMDCGKSTLALQMAHNHRARGLEGLTFARLDRAGEARLSSRLGLSESAIEVTDDLDLWEHVVAQLTAGARVDFLIADEAQFYSAEQVEQLARIVDELDIEVFAFGITSDFRTELFEGSRRLIELADRTQTLQVAALCWCGRRATHNARVVDGVMVLEGDQVVVGDVVPGDTEPGDESAPQGGAGAGEVEYEVLCRRHHMRRMSSRAAQAAALSADVLPFELDACPIPSRRA